MGTDQDISYTIGPCGHHLCHVTARPHALLLHTHPLICSRAIHLFHWSSEEGRKVISLPPIVRSTRPKYSCKGCTLVHTTTLAQPCALTMCITRSFWQSTNTSHRETCARLRNTVMKVLITVTVKTSLHLLQGIAMHEVCTHIRPYYTWETSTAYTYNSSTTCTHTVRGHILPYGGAE